MTADVVFRGGLIADGTGGPMFAGDIAVSRDRIVAISEVGTLQATREVDVSGLVVAPGFVDMHSHSDLAVLADPAHEAKVLQGVTLEVLGQDGLSFAPVSTETLTDLRTQLEGWCGAPRAVTWDWRSVGDFLDRIDDVTPVNVVYLVPHGNVRLLVMGHAARRGTDSEIVQMQRLIAQGLTEGAAGLSTGLTYVPAAFAETSELVELCRTVAEFDGIFSIHHRNYGAEIFGAYRECIDIAQQSGVALHLSHAHLNFPRNNDRAGELLSLIDGALDRGVDVTFDTYPYTAGATYLHALMPSWALRDGVEGMQKLLVDSNRRNRILRELEFEGTDGHHGMPADWSTIVLSGAQSQEYSHFVGASIADIAAALGRPGGHTYLDILLAEGFAASCIVEVGNEANVRTMMTHRNHTAGSDGILVGQRPHPRGWGTFPRYLATYVRELGVLSIQECVQHFTSNATRALGLRDRGVLARGMYADIVCFSAAEVRDLATMQDPRRSPVGIPYVMINGEFAVEDGVRTDSSAGRVLRG